MSEAWRGGGRQPDESEVSLPVRIGPYVIHALLGAGAMGRVYEASDPRGQRRALKVLDARVQAGRRARTRFAREARIAASVRDRHVVGVVEVHDGDTPYLVLELVTGGDLARVLRRVGCLSPPVATRLFADASRGLSAIHAAGLVHRDVKPSNLMLHEEGTEVVVKVGDFGLARLVGAEPNADELTASQQLLGSPLYMSPEQVRDARRVDARSDVWSLGVSLYVALGGEPPWSCETVGELLVAICTEDIVPLRERAPWVPEELARVVHRCLARRRDERPSSMAELATMLETHASTQPLRRPQLEAGDPHAVLCAGHPDAPSEADSITREAPPVMSRPPTPLTARGSRQWRRAGLGGVLLAALSIMAAWRIAESRPSPSGTHLAGPPERDAGPQNGQTSPAIEARVRIDPPDARVWVDGVEATVEGGQVVLAGEPGQSLEMLVASGSRLSHTTVVLARDGRAAPGAVGFHPEPRPAVEHDPSAPASAVATVSLPPRHRPTVGAAFAGRHEPEAATAAGPSSRGSADGPTASTGDAAPARGALPPQEEWR